MDNHTGCLTKAINFIISKFQSGNVKTRSMTRNRNRDDTSSMNRINVGVATWSDINHDVLFLVIMQLGVIDFLAFGGVCKSWRSFALSNRNMFMVSKPPMAACISPCPFPYKKVCYLEDFEGRKFKTTLPHSGGRTCVGLTCGYLILFHEKIRDFWLVNPITRRKLHFPAIPRVVVIHVGILRAILVFSSSIGGWVFVVINRYSERVWFSIEGKHKWNHASTPSYIHDLHVFKGKIYTIHSANRLCEMKLHSRPKFVLLETMNFPNREFYSPVFVSSGENLYVMDCSSRHPLKIYKIDFGEMKYVLSEKTKEEYVFFFANFMPIDDIKQLWIDIRPHSEIYRVANRSGKDWFFKGNNKKDVCFFGNMWYFIDDCLNVNLLHE